MVGEAVTNNRQIKKLLISWINAYFLLLTGHILKLNQTMNFGENSIVTTYSNIGTWMKCSTHAGEQEFLRISQLARRTF